MLGFRTGEQPAQHQRLRDGGVLVLVEQHHRELLALGLAHLGAVAGEPGGERDLVGEVHQAEMVLQAAVGLDQVEQLGPAVDRADRLVVLVAVGLAVLGGHPLDEQRPLLGVVSAHLLGRDQVLGHRRVEREQVVDRGLGVVGEQLDRLGEPLDGTGSELVARRVGDQPGVRLVADAQAVVGEEGGGVGVVRRDGGLLDLALVSRLRDQSGAAQRLADPAAELAGGLGGERQPEHLVGAHLAGGDQPDDAGGHDSGLAGPGARDDDGRRQRGGDRGELGLAEREVQPHQVAQRLGCLDAQGCGASGHESTVPGVLVGQIAWNAQ